VTTEQRRSVESHFAELAELSTEARAKGLAAIEDATIRDEVAALLNNADSTKTGMMESVAGLMAESVAQEPTSVAGRTQAHLA
jgi:hypothetical protein